MAASLEQHPQLENHQLKQRRLVITFGITGHATPASVAHRSDLPGIMRLSTEGVTADAIDSGMNVTEDDGATNSVFGILLTNVGSIKKVLKATVTDMGTERGGADTSTATPVTLAGASNTGITASGNIALSVAGTGLDIGAPENFEGVLEIDYLLAE